MISNDDHSPDQYNISAKRHIPSNSQMIQLQDPRGRLEAGQKVLYLFKVVTQLYCRVCREYSQRGHDEFAMTDGI
jgi:hypothetical protein